ncbi:MAG: hypothetical protein KDA29_04705 [Phycisphaerales bacterium]|nr:hypothetical protein [Phycisphaerales bacterium]
MSKNTRNERITALALRCSAGCAPERRGSALLIVIGTLALVAVFAAVYISIGRTDRRAANALKTRSEQRDLAVQAGDYFADVIARDRLDMFVQYDVNGAPFGSREVTDALYTDWTRISEGNLSSTADLAKLFTPWGGPYLMDGRSGGLTATTDFRVASDPWLAATTPTYLGFPGNPVTDERPFGTLIPFSATWPNGGNYLDNRDWLQISNFAPDGRPVNLFNLRPNASPVRTGTVAQNVVGGFDSEPGVGESDRATDGRPIRRMSNYLSLLRVADPGNPQSLLQAFDPATGGIWVPGYNDPQTGIITGNDVYNTPAVWTMYQRFMYMPMNQPFTIYNRNGTGEEATWADPDFPAYQYADADGDGFADSRWFELVTARDANAAGNARRDDIARLFEQDDMRFFFAARAVDLSSMVNVNTATDQLVQPSVEYPMGSSPAEIDLRRLLTMQDTSRDFAASVPQGGVGIPLSLSVAPRPTTSLDFAEYFSWRLGGRGNDFQRNPQDYMYYQATDAANPASRDNYRIDSNAPAMLIGRYAYSALRRAINLGGSLNNNYTGVNIEQGGTVDTSDPAQLYQFEGDTAGNQPTAMDRYQGYLAAGRQYTAYNGLNSSVGGLFGIDDLAEILTYHGLNDPDFTSRLERVMDGRFDSTLPSSNADPLQTRRLSPLLSNRDIDLDRFKHGRILSKTPSATQQGDIWLAPTGDPDGAVTDTSRIGEISPNSLALMALTPRKRMTTLSGFSGISPDNARRVSLSDYVDASLPRVLADTDALLPLSGLMQNPFELFNVYAKSLAGELEDMRQIASWDTDISMRDQFAYSTLFYGHRGPELALRIAAHKAVNTADLMDSDQEPTVATVILDNTRRAELENTSNFPEDFEDANPGNPFYRDFPGRASGVYLDPAANLFDEAPLADGELPVNRRAVNVYGMEAMPVITEVASFYVYTDSPVDLAAGDNDAVSQRPAVRANGLVGPLPDEIRRITIDGDVDYGNPDMLMQCIAFQLYNPWDEPISLGGVLKDIKPNGQTTTLPINNGDPLTRMRDFNDNTIIDTSTGQYQFGYYIEWNGHFFKLAELERYYPPASSPFNRRSNDNNLTGASNPAIDFPVDGGYLDPDPTSGYSDFVSRNVVLQPGETRVFYAMGDHRMVTAATQTLQSNLLIDQRWFDALEGNLAFDFDDRPWTDVTTDANTDGVPDFDNDQDGLADGKDARGWTGPAQEFAEKQLSPAINSPVLVHPMNPQTGEYLDTEVAVYNFLQTPGDISTFSQLTGTTNRVDPNEVRLWRKITTPGEEENDPGFSNRTTENLLHNDLLVDRMNISGTGVAQPLAAGDNEIQGTASFPEDYPATQAEVDAGVRNDNTGYTLMRWASTRRRKSADPMYKGDNYQPNTQETSQIREWLLSSRVNFADSVISVDNNIDANPPTIEEFREGVTVADAADDIFYGDDSATVSDYEYWRYLVTMFQGPSVVVTVDQAPFVKDDLDARYPNNGAGSEAKFDDGSGGMWTHRDGSTKLHHSDTMTDPEIDIDYDPTAIRPQLPSSNAVNGARPRLADLLLSMGIGPTFAPSSPGSLDDAVAEYHAEEWITFPEALAIALGYEDPSPNPGTLAADSIWADTWRPSTEEDQRLFDAGRLAIDRFVPFVNSDPGEDPNEFDPGSDVLRGAGVPLAAGVVDRARAISAISRVTDPSGSSADTPEYLLTHATFGTININTAPLEVLRLLPGLTPSRGQYVNTAGTTTTTDEWWGKLYSSGSNDLTANANLPNLDTIGDSTNLNIEENPDVAAAIVAYRDRTYAIPNTAARPEPVTNGGFFYSIAPMFLSAESSNLPTIAQNMIGEVPPMMDPIGGNFSMDRETFTGIDGLRTTPGFGSLGELLAVRLDPEFNGGGNNADRWRLLRHLSIDQLGYDERAQGVAPNANGDPVTMLPELFGNSIPGNTVDDYAEKLAIANGVLNLISVRSDYYAVWFVVQGYRESDVANLRPEDPLIPSLQKRYIMVVDRSNVVEAGDKPQIVLLKEVPL